jgi:C1A family cysteine protease
MKIIKKSLCVLLSALTLTGSAFAVGFNSFAAQPEIGILEIDDSNPYDFEHYVNEPEKEKSRGGIEIKDNEEKTTRSADIPSYFDSRDYGYVTPVRNQLNTGTCWAHAAMSAVESYEVKNRFADADGINFSEAHLTWFALNPNSNGVNSANDGTNLGVNAFSNGGNWRYAALALANREGASNDADYPLSGNYSDMAYGESERFDHSANVGLKDIALLDSAEEIKSAVMNNGSVTCAIYYSFSYLASKTISGVKHSSYFCSSGQQSNHAVNIIGWDDSFPKEYFKDSPQSDGAWLCRNSYGVSWGEGGYFWLSYEDKSLSQVAGYSTFDSTDIVNNYSYTSALFKAVVPDIGTYSSAYTAKGYEKIRYVSIYNLTEKATITVSVYKNLSADGTPQSGSLAGTSTGYFSNEGFYTFDLGGISVAAGERFSVVVSTVSAEKVKIPIETSGIGSFTCGKKESYLKLGSTWVDLAEQGFGNTYVFVNTECDHQLKAERIASTCTHNGNYKVYCARCGRIETERVLPLSEHDYSVMKSSEGASNEIVYTYYCSECGAPSGKTETHLKGSRTITFAELIQRIFEMFFGRLKGIKAGDRIR